VSDAVDISVALLRKFADFTKTLSEEELVGIATGALKIGLRDAPQKAARSTKTAPRLDAEDLSRRLTQMANRVDAAAFVDSLGLSLQALRDTAKALGASIAGATTKVAVRDRIVEHAVGFRLDSATLRGGSWAEELAD